MSMSSTLDLAAIGNSNVAALIDKEGTFVWTCWPRMDGDPIFCALVDGDVAQSGFFSISSEEKTTTSQTYLRNTAIVRTQVVTDSGASFAITDFAPRFHQHDRTFRPEMFVRRVEPLSGVCRIKVQIRPRTDYGKTEARATAGSNHIRYEGERTSIRLTTDAPIDYIVEEKSFVLNRPLTFILHADETFADNVSQIGAEFEHKTRDFWLNWVRNLNLPFEWQEAVIRAAITLQLCSYHQTGGIVAALTTSIPENPLSQRNWDYRYCWIRDAYFTVLALNRVGATRSMERFIEYITNIVCLATAPAIKPVYAIIPGNNMEERDAPCLKGYRNHVPVRIGNAAALQVQHDVYGSIILAASQMFFDERLPQKGGKDLFDLLEPLGHHAYRKALTPDAGIWEFRQRERIHTHSAVMCWAACDRLSRIAHSLGLPERKSFWRSAAQELQTAILSRAWSEKLGCFSGNLDCDDLDASVLLMQEIGIVAANDPRYIATVEKIGKDLMRGNMLMRYASPDDFGMPSAAFTICSFWYVEALAAIGRPGEARRIFEELLTRRNHVGLLSEDIDPATGELWGNFPQTYSMVGIIVCAMRLSRGWEFAR